MNFYNDSYTRYRPLNMAGLLSSAGALLFAILYLQHQLGITACPLCSVSRLLMLSAALLFLLACLHNPRQWGQRFYALVGTIVSLLGIGLNLRHIWLQQLAPQPGSQCDSLDLMLQTDPFHQVVIELLNNAGPCVEPKWSLLGASLPQLTLSLFLLLICIQLTQLRRSRRRNYFK